MKSEKMSRLSRRTGSLSRPVKRRFGQQVYILMAYDSRDQSLRLVWTGFRNRSRSATEVTAWMRLVQEMLKDSAEVTQPENTVEVPLRINHPAGELTAREVELLLLIAQGKTSAEIAEAMSISPRTMQRHLGNLLRTLKARNRLDALLKAIQWGVIRLTPSPSTALRRPTRGTGGSRSRRR